MSCLRFSLALLLIASAAPLFSQVKTSDKDFKIEFRTSDRCVACHNGLKTKAGEDISIGFAWRASIMANSSRDPYWQGSVRRESIDHPAAQAAIEDECSTCHMPLSHFTAHAEGRKAQVFSHLPLVSPPSKDGAAADGVSCSVCHQVEKAGLGTPASFSGGLTFASLHNTHQRPEYGPFVVDQGHQRVMQSSTGGMVPQASDHIRDSALCGSCHTLYTKALGPGGQQIGTFPEQMPYLEWLHSDYPKRNTCQSCHMPEVQEPVAVTAIYGPLRQGMHRHEFIGGNFLVQQMLNDYRGDLHTAALPRELVAASGRTVEFLKSQSARVSLQNVQQQSGSAFARRPRRESHRPQAADCVSIAPCVAAHHRAGPRRPNHLRIGRAQSRRLHRRQCQRRRPAPLRAALSRDHQAPAGRDLRAHPRRRAQQRHHRPALRRRLSQGQPPAPQRLRQRHRQHATSP